MINKQVASIASTVLATLIVSMLTGLAAWAYRIEGMVSSHQHKMIILLTEDGRIRPSLKVEILEEKFKNHNDCHEDD